MHQKCATSREKADEPEGKLCAIFEEVGCLEMSASEKSYLSAGKYSSNLDEVEVEEDFLFEEEEGPKSEQPGYCDDFVLRDVE